MQNWFSFVKRYKYNGCYSKDITWTPRLDTWFIAFLFRSILRDILVDPCRKVKHTNSI